MKRSAAGAGMRIVTCANSSGSADRIGSNVTTASTSDLLEVRSVSTVVLWRSVLVASIRPASVRDGSPGPVIRPHRSVPSSEPVGLARMSPALRSCWRISPASSMPSVSVLAEALAIAADTSVAIADATRPLPSSASSSYLHQSREDCLAK